MGLSFRPYVKGYKRKEKTKWKHNATANHLKQLTHNFLKR
jgi:hypothetical protein